ncbi:MAG: SAM-dependent DNA methyltransferase [Verrucomicrobia bacterium]|nr:SAM-dependent DNA methyltransferase [Verrucomicrobiota bacterium]
MASQIVSKQRVTDHGEVLTAAREVSAMLDLVKQETERIESRFLEPACGNGNFLAEILERKLRVVESRYGRSQLDYERKAVLAVSFIYGIDILEDNVAECRARLFAIFDRRYAARFKTSARAECRDAVRYILERNIIHGDALSLKTVGPVQYPIIFSEWSAPFDNSLLKRRDYTFSDLIQGPESRQQNLLLTDEYSDQGKRAFIPKELTSFPLIHFLKVRQHDE